MNIDGNTIQERVRTRKEKEFDYLFLKKTKYQGIITSIDEEEANIVCSIQPNSWRQDKIVSNILVSLKNKKLKTGALIETFQKNKEEELSKIWLVLMVSDDITHGYQSYEAIELDSVINFTDEYGDTIKQVPVKFVNETSVSLRIG